MHNATVLKKHNQHHFNFTLLAATFEPIVPLFYLCTYHGIAAQKLVELYRFVSVCLSYSIFN